MLAYIIVGVVVGFILLMLLRRTSGNAHFDFSLKCKECGWHKGVLKCMNCEDRKRDKWR